MYSGAAGLILLAQTESRCSATGIVWQHNTADLTQADKALNAFAAPLPAPPCLLAGLGQSGRLKDKRMQIEKDMMEGES